MSWRFLLAVGLMAGLVTAGYAEADLPWVYENNHPVDQVTESSSDVTLAEASFSGLESTALDFFCSYWCNTFEVGTYTVLAPHRGVTIVVR